MRSVKVVDLSRFVILRRPLADARTDLLSVVDVLFESGELGGQRDGVGADIADVPVEVDEHVDSRAFFNTLKGFNVQDRKGLVEHLVDLDVLVLLDTVKRILHQKVANVQGFVQGFCGFCHFLFLFLIEEASGIDPLTRHLPTRPLPQ